LVAAAIAADGGRHGAQHVTGSIGGSGEASATALIRALVLWSDEKPFEDLAGRETSPRTPR
jgi:hypothetical protein